MEFDQIVNDVFFAGLGIIVAYVTKRWRTPHEKAIGNLELLERLAKELDTTTDQLIDSFRDSRVTKRRMELLIGYLIQTFEHMARHRLTPLPLPAELESDPDLVKYFKPKTRRKKKS